MYGVELPEVFEDLQGLLRLSDMFFMEELREEEMLKKRPGDVDWDEGDFFWLIQMSDLHISQYVYPDLQEDLHSFLEQTVEVVYKQ